VTRMLRKNGFSMLFCTLHTTDVFSTIDEVVCCVYCFLFVHYRCLLMMFCVLLSLAMATHSGFCWTSWLLVLQLVMLFSCIYLRTYIGVVTVGSLLLITDRCTSCHWPQMVRCCAVCNTDM